MENMQIACADALASCQSLSHSLAWHSWAILLPYHPSLSEPAGLLFDRSTNPSSWPREGRPSNCEYHSIPQCLATRKSGHTIRWLEPPLTMPFWRYIPCFKLFIVYSLHCIACFHILQGTTLDKKILSHFALSLFPPSRGVASLSPWLPLVIKWLTQSGLWTKNRTGTSPMTISSISISIPTTLSTAILPSLLRNQVIRTIPATWSIL